MGHDYCTKLTRKRSLVRDPFIWAIVLLLVFQMTVTGVSLYVLLNEWTSENVWNAGLGLVLCFVFGGLLRVEIERGRK